MGNRKTQIRQKTRKLNESRKIYKFCGNRVGNLYFLEIGGIFNMHHWLKGKAYFNSLNGGTNAPPLSGFVPLLNVSHHRYNIL